MKKDIFRFTAIAIIVVLFGIFVYPTMYKYDKYNQKVPVRINRITGEAYLLDPEGWKKAGSDVPSESEMEKLRREVINMLADDRNSLKSDIETDLKSDLDKIKEGIVSDIQSDINSAKQDVQVYKTAELDPNSYFGMGSTMDEVKKIMGVPSGVNKFDYTNEEIWRYDVSTVTFKNGKVVEWSDYSNNLKIK